MKRRLKPLFLSAVVLLGVFLLAGKMVFFEADATYVEGAITQDTVWTLIDSPFIVSKNVTVRQNVRLTIEPGVEIRFGGNFSLIVEGSLSASGTEKKSITFTSNKDQPKGGDWGTIRFLNGTAPSTLAYCVIGYAQDGMTIQNSNVVVENSEVSTSSRSGIRIFNSTVDVHNSLIKANSQSGIRMENGVVDIEDNTISDNLGSGVYVTSGSKAVVQNNIVRANLNGLFLTGNQTVSANITRNTILSNTQSGIYVDVKDFSNINILYNVLSANNRGLYVTGQGSTYITNNSIAYNNVGIFYEEATHTARWNDIYGNGFGMDVASNATVAVDAEHNYWGDESGPHHISLNPAGKGNPVGGNGYNLDFLFFLTAPIGYINQRPIARLLTDKILVQQNQVVWFVATHSSDDRRVNQYSYDFGDGTNSGWTTLSLCVHTYSSLGNFTATVLVKDDFDVPSVNVASVDIRIEPLISSLDVSLTLGSSKVVSEGQVSVTARATVGTSPVGAATIRLITLTEGNLEVSFGTTNSTGYFTTMLLAPNVTQQTDVRIIATASKSGYADGSDYEYLEVLPPLTVRVTADPASIKSEATSHVIVYVTHNNEAVSGATIMMSADSGSLSTATGMTDLNGSIAFTFTAPQVMTPTNVTITANAAKSGYFEGTAQTKMPVTPRVLEVEVSPSVSSIESKTPLNVTVHVTEGASPVAGANVTLSSDLGGTLSATTGTTDSNGDFMVIFIAPETNTQIDVTLTARATKVGYIDGETQSFVTVTPLPATGPAGLPWTHILLILIPIVVVVVVVILFKKRIIVITRE